MKSTLVVPIDFTPVSHEALLFACELSVNRNTEIIAVHVLDSNLIATDGENNTELQAAVEQLKEEMINKTKSNLDNFLDGLIVFYGDIIRPLVVFGTIYDAFNDVAKAYHSPLIVMGTHGIVGMQHIFGSKAYKVVVNTPIPFLIVQERSFGAMNKIFLTLESIDKINIYEEGIKTFARFFDGNFICNIMSECNPDELRLPESLVQLSDRFSFVQRSFVGSNVEDCAKEYGADAIAICIDEKDNLDSSNYGMTQDKILVNKYKLPVLCFPVI